ncbi:MAG: carboxylating nicotinate-nucleotide diphosphorylase [Alphaproteobacteria bacterium]|tara:strand:- start:3 stop:848 length:846 start_codon:yes stop_codon:yes gene_type:complete
MKILSNPQLKKIVKLAIKEDLGKLGDITSNTVLTKRDKATFHFVSRAKGILCGINIAKIVYELLDDKIIFTSFKKDGDLIKKNEILAKVEGPAISLLTGERTALNFLTHLSGIATSTSMMVKLILHTDTKILCTRKTTPGLRNIEKYAVKVGGGINHRIGLFDAILIKDNHIAIAGSISNALKKVKKLKNRIKIEIEVDNLKQFKEAIKFNPDVIMLDNFKINDLKKAVKLGQKKVILEASGKIDYLNVAKIAATGVNFISSGWITHSSKSLDIGLDLIKK